MTVEVDDEEVLEEVLVGKRSFGTGKYSHKKKHSRLDKASVASLRHVDRYFTMKQVTRLLNYSYFCRLCPGVLLAYLVLPRFPLFVFNLTWVPPFLSLSHHPCLHF